MLKKLWVQESKVDHLCPPCPAKVDVDGDDDDDVRMTAVSAGDGLTLRNSIAL